VLVTLDTLLGQQVRVGARKAGRRRGY
jgi:hypothetical protein